MFLHLEDKGLAMLFVKYAVRLGDNATELELGRGLQIGRRWEIFGLQQIRMYWPRSMPI